MSSSPSSLRTVPRRIHSRTTRVVCVVLIAAAAGAGWLTSRQTTRHQVAVGGPVGFDAPRLELPLSLCAAWYRDSTHAAAAREAHPDTVSIPTPQDPLGPAYAGLVLAVTADSVRMLTETGRLLSHARQGTGIHVQYNLVWHDQQRALSGLCRMLADTARAESQRLRQWVAQRTAGRPVVFEYHRIQSLVGDPWSATRLALKVDGDTSRLTALYFENAVPPKVRADLGAPTTGVSLPHSASTVVLDTGAPPALVIPGDTAWATLNHAPEEVTPLVAVALATPALSAYQQIVSRVGTEVGAIIISGVVIWLVYGVLSKWQHARFASAADALSRTDTIRQSGLVVLPQVTAALEAQRQQAVERLAYEAGMFGQPLLRKRTTRRQRYWWVAVALVGCGMAVVASVAWFLTFTAGLQPSPAQRVLFYVAAGVVGLLGCSLVSRTLAERFGTDA